MEQFKFILDRKLGGAVQVSFVARGGIGLDFVQDNLYRARNADIVVVMAGGNDVASGAGVGFLVRSYENIIDQAARLNIKSTVFMSLWPRSNCRFNNQIRRMNVTLWRRFSLYPRVVVWFWDRRLSMRTFDGVHLDERGYRKANFYLFAPIAVTLRENLNFYIVY